MSRYEYDLCVIGGGSAGLVTAAGAAQLGARVALIERARMGGECLNSGCVPSKALLRSAEVAMLMRRGAEFGLGPTTGSVDLGSVMKHVRDVIREIAPHDSPERYHAMGVEVIAGDARFTAPHAVDISGCMLSARWFVIATGSEPLLPPVPGLGELPILTNENIFAVCEPVPHLVVLGGGPIGLELAQAFSRLGSTVTVVQAAPHVLPREDTDVANAVQKALEVDGVKIICGSRAERAAKSSAGISLQVLADNHTLLVEGSHLLVATGRRPRLEGLNLEAAGLHTVEGRLPVDTRLRTHQKHIYACGDVVGPYRFTHMAEHQAGIVLRNIIFRIPAKVENRVVPWCTFTDPEVARVGLSEAEAVQTGVRHEVFRVPFSSVDRAITDRSMTGFVKVIANPRGKLLGAAIVGAHAGELIHEYALALRHGLHLKDISAVIHVYPTYSQANRFAADMRLKRRLTPAGRRWIKRIFGLHGST